MRDFRDAKAMAQTLREELKAKGVSLTHSDNLELVAKVLGFHDWNTLAAKIQSEGKPPDAGPATSRTSRAMGINCSRDLVDNNTQFRSIPRAIPSSSPKSLMTRSVSSRTKGT
jgi:uncharacterized protein